MISVVTEHPCACCDVEIQYDEEIWVLEVCTALPQGPEVIIADDGDYEAEVYFLHYACWEALLERLREATRDQPPARVPGATGTCVVCKTQIEPSYPVCTATVSEIVVSDKFPDGLRADELNRLGKPDLVCLACAAIEADEHFPLWSLFLDDLGEFR